MKNFLLIVLLIFCSSLVYSQNFSVHYFQSHETNTDSPLWGNDIMISSTEPMGRMSAVERSNGNIYVSIPDTNINPGQGYSILIYVSTNHGLTFSSLVGLHPAFICGKTKMVRTGLDSVICFFWYGTAIYNWNVLNGRISVVSPGPITDFDVAATSTGGLYVFADTLTATTHSVLRKGSSDGGISWPNRGTVASNSAKPRVSKSYTGDTLFLNYYSPVLVDTFTSVIRQGRYRESSLGVISSFSFINVATETDAKLECTSVAVNNIVWFFNTTGTTGSIDLLCRVSSDNGATFGSPFTIAGGVNNVDEYWIDAKLHMPTTAPGVDIIYYRDSLQSGNPNLNSDKLMYRWAAATLPGTFNSPAQIDNANFPGWSSRLYIPTVIELYSTTDLGAIWVGSNGTNKRLFYNRMNSVSGLSNNNNIVPDKYSLSQNYPNPFNPVTKIDFAISKNEFVTIKIYDLLGKEIMTLVSENLKSGNYSYSFNASNLTSGVYFYKINAGNFSDTKKMVLLK